MKALEKTLAILAFVILVSQAVRDVYLLWVQPRTSVLDKYEQPLKDQITQAKSLDELLRRYDPIRKQADAARDEVLKSGKPFSIGDAQELEPYKSEIELRTAIQDWEDKSKEIYQIRFYCLVAFVIFILGAVIYKKWNRWLGLTLLIAAFVEFIYWTSPTFLGPNSHEVDRLLANKLVLSIVVFLLLLLAIRLNGIFSEGQKPGLV